MAFCIFSMWLQCFVPMSALNISVFKLKSSNCGISPLITWVKFFHEINVSQFTWQKHVPSSHPKASQGYFKSKVYVLCKLREWDLYLFKRAATTVIKMPKGIYERDWQIIFILILILVFSKLKPAFCKYWTSIKIKISMNCVYRVWS